MSIQALGDLHLKKKLMGPLVRENHVQGEREQRAGAACRVRRLQADLLMLKSIFLVGCSY